MSTCCKKMSCMLVLLSLASIVGAVAIWYLSKGALPEEVAHAERFGIFVGLWAPTFLGLANYLKGGCSNSCGSVDAEKKAGCCNS